MAQTLAAHLGDRRGDDWLIGPGSATFWHRLETIVPTFQAYRASGESPWPGVLIAEPNPPEFLVACLGAWSAGCIPVLANPRWGEGEHRQLQRLVHPDWAHPMRAGQGCYPCQVPRGQPGQILIPTGGSSGQIKFAVHSWETLGAAIAGFQAHFGVGPVHAYCVLPLYHVSGLMQALRVLVSGGCLALQTYAALKSGERLALPPGGFLSLVPTQLRDLLALGPAVLPWLKHFRAVLLGGAPAGRSLLDQAQAAAIPIALTYGMTETAAQVATLRPEEFLAGHRSSGQPLPHVAIAIVNAQGQPLPPGQPGQIVLRARSQALAYLPMGEANPAVSALATDDVGYVDGAGYLHIVGRRSTKIITGGEKVFPEEIEAVLLTLGGVQEACLVGLPCDRWGQMLCALVVASPGCLQTLPERLRPRLAAHKLPKRWILVAALPTTPQGKLSRPRALALAQRVLGLDCTAALAQAQ